jgi:hypothetical protein
MASSAQPTTDHDLIKNWVEDRGGWPAHVKRTSDDDDTGIIRIDFPGGSGEESLERISWDEFFEQFEAKNLALLVQEEINGEKSRFNKIVSRDTVET